MVECQQQGTTQATTGNTPTCDPHTINDRDRRGYDYLVQLLNIHLYSLGETTRPTWTRTNEATRRVWVDAAAQRANLRLGVKNKVEGA